MLGKMKKIVCFMLCTALLCTLMIVPAQAEANTISYLLNEDFNSGSNVTHFVGGHGFLDFADGHGKAAQLYADTTKTFTTSSGNLATNPVDQVLSFDIYLGQTDTRYDVIAYDDTDATQVHMVFYSDGVMCYNNKALTMADPTEYNAIKVNNAEQKYEISKWHNVTIYFDYRDATTGASVGNSYVFLDGVRITTKGIANYGKGINKISFHTPVAADASNKRAYVDNVKLHYVEDASCYGEVTENNDNVAVNFTEVLGDGTDEVIDYTGTTLTNKYTGEAVDADIVSSNRKQLVLKPETGLTPGAQYIITLPEGLKRWNGYDGQGTNPVAEPKSPIASNIIEFTADMDNDKVLMYEDGTNSGTNNVFKPATTYTQVTMGTDAEKGALKIDYDSSISSTNGKISFNNAHANNSVIGINYVQSRSFEASLDFMVPEKAYYGGVTFTLNSASSTEEAVAHFQIGADGMVKCFPSNQNSDTASTYSGYYNVNEWNNLKVIFDASTNKLSFYVNGRFIRDREKAKYTGWADTDVINLMSVYYRPLAAANTKTTMYIDNVCVKESYTGVSDIAVGTNSVWTKGEISATDAKTIELTFDDELLDGFEFGYNNIRLYCEENSELIESYSYADKKVTLALKDELVSDTEYTLAVWDVKDALNKTITPYETKFTTKPLEISDLKIADENGEAVVYESLNAGAKVYALPTVDGRADAVVVLAQYNGGKLTQITPLTAVTLEKDMEKTAELTVGDTNDLVLKAFIWDGITNIAPLTAEETVKAD